MNVIISAATGYSVDQIRCFLESVHRHCPDTSVYLLVFETDCHVLQVLPSAYPQVQFVRSSKREPFRRAARLQRSFARAISTIDPFCITGPLRRRLCEYFLHISLGRYFVAHDLIGSHRGEFEYVLLADCRDVVLQSNPFLSVGNDVLTGTEEQRIGNCPYNTKWVGTLFGCDILRDLADRVVVCSGVSIGPAGAVQQYLTEMCKVIWRHLGIVMFDNGYDQGIHEYLVHEHAVPVVLTDPREGVIATLGYEPPEQIVADASTGRIRVRGVYPQIVHQYDRHPTLAAFVEQVYAGAGEA